jgi:hypothetical protein
MHPRGLFLFAIVFTLAFSVTGCAWLPTYVKAKMAIDARYREKERKLDLRYSLGQISDASYEKEYDELYRQWDRELTIAKARAQGIDVAQTGSSSRRRSSSATTKPVRFETQSTEYVGSSLEPSVATGSGSSAPAAGSP